jgi:8-oxo-dGTP diphosphatase
MILKDGKVLLGKRKGSHGAGEYSFPGGHLEHLESFEECGRREVREECGVEVRCIRFQLLSNVTGYAPKHYVHVGLIAEYESGEPRVLESEKCESWGWYSLDDLPQPLFIMCQQGIECHRSGEHFLDSSTAQPKNH